MALKLRSGRQFAIIGYVDVGFADLESGVDVPVFELPQGAVVIGGNITTTEAFNSETSDAVNIGDAGAQNRYLNASSLAALANAPLVPTQYVNTAPTLLTARWTGVGDPPTTGKFTLWVHYFVKGRENFAQGKDT